LARSAAFHDLDGRNVFIAGVGWRAAYGGGVHD